MSEITVERLGSLHDAVVHDVRYDAIKATEREIRISMSCSAHIDYSPWAGKRVDLVVRNVWAMRQLLWSTGNWERLNLVTAGVSDEARLELRLANRRSSNTSAQELTIIFHSGSSLEIVFEDFSVEVQE